LTTRGITNTQRLKTGIGDVVINFQFLEYELSEILSRALGFKNQDDAHRIGAAMSFKQKLNLYCELYAERDNKGAIKVDILTVRKAMAAAEEFRNSVVHSFWHVSGNKDIVWMRTKSNIASKSGLKISAGVADIRKLEAGVECLKIIRGWYLGDTKELEKAIHSLRRCASGLSRKVNYTQ
jgi:hypothetical protein